MLRALVAVAAVLVVTGCSGSSSDKGSSSESTAKPSESPSATASQEPQGPQIRGTGYTFRVPEGWDRQPPIAGFDLDSNAADLRDDDGFADNVNVTLSPPVEMRVGRIERGARGRLVWSGAAADVTVNDRVTVAGVETAHVTAAMSSDGTRYTVDQFLPTHGGRVFIVTFSFSESVTRAERAEVTDATLASWTWTD